MILEFRVTSRAHCLYSPFSLLEVAQTNSTFLQTETALMYDAALLFATALSELDRSQEIETAVLSCDSEQSWEHGNSLINYMKLVSIQRIVYLYPMPVFFMIILMIVIRLRWTDSVGGSSLMGPASAVIFSLILWN